MTQEPAADRVDAARGPGGSVSPDSKLVARLRAGDEAAFVELVTSHATSMLRVARMYCPAAVAEDVLQDTWIGVIRGLDSFDGRASLRTWMFRILVNIARTRGKREHRQIPYSAFVDPAAEPAEPAVDAERFRPAGEDWSGHWVSYPQRWDELPEQRWLSREATAEIRAAIDALPPAQREVVTLRDVVGWSADEVCAALGLSPGNQRVILHRGRSRVRRALEEIAARQTADARTTKGPAR